MQIKARTEAVKLVFQHTKFLAPFYLVGRLRPRQIPADWMRIPPEELS
jgi:hypothetical protein